MLAKINGTVLYDNASGSTGNITLSDSAANYTYLEILYKSNDDDYASVKIYQPNGKRACLHCVRANTATPRIYGKTRVVSISGSSITSFTGSNSQYTVNNGSASGIVANNYIYITRVIGYN